MVYKRVMKIIKIYWNKPKQIMLQKLILKGFK